MPGLNFRTYSSRNPMEKVSRLLTATVLIPIFLVIACEEPEIADQPAQDRLGELRGTWVDSVYGPADVYTIYELAFIDSTFVHELRTYHSAIAPPSLEYWSRIEGVVTVDPDKMHWRLQEQQRWQRNTGKAIHVQVDTTAVLYGYTYALGRDTLTLTYTSYPFDAPVDTYQTYIRRQAGVDE